MKSAAGCALTSASPRIAFWLNKPPAGTSQTASTTLDHRNLIDYYKAIELTDLSGIAKHFEARLNAVASLLPYSFLEASADYLKRFVFHSVIGEDWHNRLRGHEVDGNPTNKGQVGRQFVLDVRTNEDSVILPRFHYLCETNRQKTALQQLRCSWRTGMATFQTGDYWYKTQNV